MGERLGDVAEKVRSKNAGPFWVTIDVFCGSATAYRQVEAGLSSAAVAALFGVSETRLKRYDLPDLHVVKFSLPRPAVQGAAEDRDMHGAGWAAIVAAMPLTPNQTGA
ncbi:MAG: DUF4387 family protein [Pseudomonadota bacterium]|mgnify:CR=1 FL=1